jgi:inosose dehydratase
MMRVGTAPISWGVSEMPDWGQVLPAAQVLDEMAATGYAGTELGPWGYLPDNIERLRADLDGRGLALIGGFCPVTLHLPERQAEQQRFALEVARRLRDLGATVLVLAEAGDAARLASAGHVAPGSTPAFAADDWRRFAAGAAAIAAAAREIGLTTAFHPHVGSYVETEAEIADLLQRTDPALLGLCVDSGHLAYAGADPVALTERYRDRIRHVHLKDVSAAVLRQAQTQGWSFAEAVGQGIFVPLGDGMVGLPAMLAALRSAEYDGWLVVEQDRRLLGAAQQTRSRADAERSRQALRAQGL